MPLRVLAVDDDDRMRRLLKVNLETDDVLVREAGTAQEGLQLAREERPDLILMDLNLPDGSGWDLLASLRSDAGTYGLPVIVISITPPDKRMMRRFKPDDYVQKPFDARDLTDRVRKILQKGAK